MASSVFIGYWGGIQITSAAGTVTITGNLAVTGQFLAADGSASAPSYSFTNSSGFGFYRVSSSILIGLAAAPILALSDGVVSSSGGSVSWGSSGIATPDLHLTREGAATLQMGLDAAGVTDQMFKGPDRITSDGVGGNLTIAGGRNRGASAGGSILFQTSPAAGAGVTGTLATALTIDSTKLATFAGSQSIAGSITSYNAVATAGQGVEVVRAQATTGTVTNSGTASIATWTPGAADVEVEVSARVNITTSTTHSFSIDVTYTDVANNARTRVLPMYPISGNQLTNSLMTNTVGVGDFASATMRIGVKASTAITVRTSAGGTFTTVVYTASGTIKQVG